MLAGGETGIAALNSTSGERIGGKEGTQTSGGKGGTYSTSIGNSGTFAHGGSTVAFTSNWYVGGAGGRTDGMVDGAGPGGGPGGRWWLWMGIH